MEVKTYDDLIKESDIKADELTRTTGKKVYSIVTNTEPFGSEEGEWVVGYIKAPTLYQKAKIIDHFDKDDKTMIGLEVLKLNLIKEYSDSRFYNVEDYRNENVILGAALFITGKGFVFSIVKQREELKKNI